MKGIKVVYKLNCLNQLFNIFNLSLGWLVFATLSGPYLPYLGGNVIVETNEKPTFVEKLRPGPDAAPLVPNPT